jgi:DNA-binding NarL/FixJ family response regulator
MQIAELFARGHSAKEAAYLLGLSYASVKEICSRIYEKLDLQKWGDPRSRLVIWYLCHRQQERSGTERQPAD